MSAKLRRCCWWGHWSRSGLEQLAMNSLPCLTVWVGAVFPYHCPNRPSWIPGFRKANLPQKTGFQKGSMNGPATSKSSKACCHCQAFWHAEIVALSVTTSGRTWNLMAPCQHRSAGDLCPPHLLEKSAFPTPKNLLYWIHLNAMTVDYEFFQRFLKFFR